MKFEVTQPGSPHEVGDIVEFDEVPQYLINKVEPVQEKVLEVATPSTGRATSAKGAKKGA